MRQVATALIAITWLALSAVDSANAQPGTVSVGFKNQTKIDVYVQGTTIVNGSPRRGNNISVPKSGGMAFESNVPTGFRFYTVFDANQPSRILLKDHRVPIQNRDALFTIMTSPTNPNQVILVPANPAP